MNSRRANTSANASLDFHLQLLVPLSILAALWLAPAWIIDLGRTALNQIPGIDLGEGQVSPAAPDIDRHL